MLHVLSVMFQCSRVRQELVSYGPPPSQDKCHVLVEYASVDLLVANYNSQRGRIRLANTYCGMSSNELPTQDSPMENNLLSP